MSSTNRSNARSAHVSDYYVTPQPTIKSFLSAVAEDDYEFLEGYLTDDEKSLTVLDPCAGGDAEHEMAYPKAIHESSGWNITYLDTIDCRPDSPSTIKADYLAHEYGPYDVIITNPPFNLALPIIEKALTEATPMGGVVIMLLRLNFFGSMQRQKFFHEQMPVLTYVHTKRPKFLNTGGTDSIEYMHCVWRAGQNCQHTALRIID